MSTRAIPITGKDDSGVTPINIIQAPPKYNSEQGHNEARIVRQVKAIKEHVGLGSVLGLIAIIIAVGMPVWKGGEALGTTTKAVERLEKAQTESDERTARALAEAINRIETGIAQSNDLARQNREDIRTMSERMERRVDKVETMVNQVDTMSKSTWNWMVELKNKVGNIEAQQQKSKEN